MSEPTNKLKAGIDFEVSDERRDRQWQNVASQLETPAKSTRRWPVAFAVGGAAAAAAVLLLVSTSSTSTQPGADLTATTRPTGQGFAKQLALPDGSSISIEKTTRLRIVSGVEDDVRLRLDEGKAYFDVAKSEIRKAFVVQAGDVSVGVIGTRFTVQRTPEGSGTRVTVAVEEGRVAVSQESDPNNLQMLSAGQSWSGLTGSAIAGSPGPQTRDPKPPRIALAQEIAPEPPRTEPASLHRPSMKPSRSAEPTVAIAPTQQSRPHRAVTQPKLARPPQRQAFANQPVPVAATPPAAAKQALDPPQVEPLASEGLPDDAPAPVETVSDARTLLQEADTARLEGRYDAAAEALNAVRTQFPQDARAALATFELGRLRMDHLADAEGALSAFQQVVQDAPGAQFVEHARARIVHVLHDLRRIEACLQAKEDYLSRYANGVHTDALAKLCQ